MGVGPVVTLPTSTEDELGIDHVAAGITGVAVKVNGPWTWGALTNYLWSVNNSDDEPDIELFYIQPFFDYTTQNAVTWELTAEASYDVEAEQWSIPVSITANKIFPIGDFLMAAGGGPRYWADGSGFDPEGWGVNVSFYIFYRIDQL